MSENTTTPTTPEATGPVTLAEAFCAAAAQAATLPELPEGVTRLRDA